MSIANVRTELLLFLLCVWCIANAPKAYAQEVGAPTVASVAVTDADKAVIESVEGLGIPVTKRQIAEGATSVDLLLWARTLPEPLLLYVDSHTSTVSVLRTDDGTSLSRVLGQETFAESPYVAALAATELLELMKYTPPTKVETAPVVPEPPRPSLAWQASLGGELQAGARKGPSLLRPALGLGAAFYLNVRAFLYAEACAMPYGVAVESLPADSGGKLRYRRSDLALRAGAGFERGAANLVGYLGSNVGFVRVQPVGVEGERARTRRRNQLSAGGGMIFRYWLEDYLGLAFGIDVAWLTSPARYLADGKLALEEDSLRIAASLSVVGRIR